MINELDSARFDPLLVRAVAKNVSSSIDNLLSRVDGLVSLPVFFVVLFIQVCQATRDRSAVALTGPTATPQQATNAQLATCLYQCWLKLNTLRNDHTEVVFDVLKSNIQVFIFIFENTSAKCLICETIECAQSI